MHILEQAGYSSHTLHLFHHNPAALKGLVLQLQKLSCKPAHKGFRIITVLPKGGNSSISLLQEVGYPLSL